MYRHVSSVALVAAFVAGALSLGTPLAAQRPAPAATYDHFLGTWVLDRTKSTFAGAVPEWRKITFEKVPNGIRHITETKQGDRIYKLEYTFQVDGKAYPADIQMSVSTVSFKQIDANTLERTGVYQGNVLETVTYQISVDRRVLTVSQDLRANNTSGVQHFELEDS